MEASEGTWLAEGRGSGISGASGSQFLAGYWVGVSLVAPLYRATPAAL